MQDVGAPPEMRRQASRPAFSLDELKHVKPAVGPVWRDRVFLGEFADAYLESTDLEGGDKAKGGDVAALLQVVHHVASLVAGNADRAWLSAYTEDDVTRLKSVCDALGKAVELARQLQGIEKPDDFAKFLFDWSGRVRTLRPGDRLVLPGGWRNTDGGHVLMHVIERTEDSRYNFTVHNCGKGVEWHPSDASAPPKVRFQTSLVLTRLSEATLCDDAFWYMFFKIQVAASDDHRHEIVYDLLLPHLLGGTPLAVYLDQQKYGGKTGAAAAAQRKPLASPALDAKAAAVSASPAGKSPAVTAANKNTVLAAEPPKLLLTDPAVPAAPAKAPESKPADTAAASAGAAAAKPVDAAAPAPAAAAAPATAAGDAKGAADAKAAASDSKMTEAALRACSVFRTPQRATTNYVPALMELLRYLCATVGHLSPVHYKQLSFAMRRQLLAMAQHDLGQLETAGVTELLASDVRLLRVACEQVSRHAVKESNATAVSVSTQKSVPRLNPQQLQELYDLVTDVDTKTTARAPKHLPAPLLVMGSKAKWQPYPDCGLLRRELSVDQFTGRKNTPSSNRLIDFCALPKPSAIRTFDDAFGAMKTCLSLLELLTQRHSPGAYFFRVSLISTLFTYILPAPRPPEAGSKTVIAEVNAAKAAAAAAVAAKPHGAAAAAAAPASAGSASAAAAVPAEDLSFDDALAAAMAASMAASAPAPAPAPAPAAAPAPTPVDVKGVDAKAADAKAPAAAAADSKSGDAKAGDAKVEKGHEDNREKTADCIWLGATLTRAQQIDALKLVYDLARHYCAAAKSVQTNRSFQAAHAIVMAAMVAVTDALVRVHATDNISMLTMVLNGTDHLAKKVRPEEDDPTPSLDIFKSKQRDYLVDNKGAKVPVDSLRGKIVGIYFSAHWCPPCRQLTPQVADIYNALKITDPDKQLEIVFVSADKDDVAFRSYFDEMPWLAIPFADSDTRSRLERRFKVKGYPTLIMLDEDARMYTADGRKTIMDGWPFGRPEVPADERARLRAAEAEAKQKRDEEKRKRDAVELEADQKRQRALKEKGASKPVFYLNVKCGGGYDLATLTERFEVAEPELVTARGAVLDYFNIMERRGARGIFAFRSKMNATTLLGKDEPTSDFIKVLCLLLGYNLNPDDDEEGKMDDQASLLEMLTFYLVDPKSPLIKDNPEFTIYRDTVFLYKLMLADPTHRRAPKLRRWQKDQATPFWSLKELNKAKTLADLNVAAFGQPSLVIDNKPPYSPAEVNAYLPDCKFPTEDDVLHCKSLPNFNDMMSQEDAEHLLSLLTVPYLRMPLVVEFFSSKDRVSVLLDSEVQYILESVLFEPGRWASDLYSQPITKVPSPNEALVGCQHGLLLNELHHSPTALLTALLKVGQLTTELNTGSYLSTSASIILFMVRVLSRVEVHLVYAIDHPEDWPAPARVELAPKLVNLIAFRRKLRRFLMGACKSILTAWEQQAQQAADLTAACVMHAHQALLYRALRSSEWDVDSVGAVLAHMAFLTTWHSPGLGQADEDENRQFVRGGMNQMFAEMQAGGGMMAEGLAKAAVAVAKDKKESDKKSGGSSVGGGAAAESSDDRGKRPQKELPPLQVPDQEVFDMFQRIRRGVVGWFATASGADKDDALSGALAASTRSPKVLMSGWTQDGKAVGMFVSPNRDVEVNVQTAEVYFRHSHIEPVPQYMSRHPDFAVVFGSQPQHCAMVASYDFCKWVRLVGRNYNLRYWHALTDAQYKQQGIKPDDHLINLPKPLPQPPATPLQPPSWVCFTCGFKNPLAAGGCKGQNCQRPAPKLKFGVAWMKQAYPRVFVQTQLTPDEKWMLDVVEPVIVSAYGKREKMPYELWMTAAAAAPAGDSKDDSKVAAPAGGDADGATVVQLMGFDEGTWRTWTVLKERGVCNVHVLLEHGRRMYRSQIYASDNRFSLHPFAPDTRNRANPWAPPVRWAAGLATEKVALTESLVISRDDAERDAQETYTPPRLLQGLLPAALLENFFFWQLDGDDTFRAYPKDRNDVAWNFKLHVRLVDLDGKGLSAVVTRAKLTAADLDRDAKAGASSFFNIKKAMDPNDPLLVAIKKSKVTTLMDQGFGAHLAETVLQMFDYDLPVAQAWLADAANEESVNKLRALKPEDQKVADVRKAIGLGGKQYFDSLAGPDAKDADPQLFLLNLLHVPVESQLGRIATALTRVEDLSHILCWSTTKPAAGAGSDVNLSLVELPRLKLKFSPRVDPASKKGTVRLYSVDHEGLFLSDFRDAPLTALMEGLQHSLVLENAARELFILVPNSPLHRPMIARCPFSTDLVLDRGNADWLSVMGTRVFLYPVHISHTFVTTPSQDSAVYLIGLRLLARQYSQAWALVQSCEADMKLTKPESWCLRQLERTNNDWHPDAHANRLKATLVMLHSGEKTPWRIREEFTSYLAKASLVSNACRLSVDEEVYLLNWLKGGGDYEAEIAEEKEKEDELAYKSQFLETELGNRLSFLTVLTEDKVDAERRAREGLRATATTASGERLAFLQNKLIRGETVQWDVVEEKTTEFFKGYTRDKSTWNARVEYVRPPDDACTLGGAVKTLNGLWKDTITGAARQLGLYYLYELLTGKVKVTLTDPYASNSFTLAKLFSRLLYLKTTNWGGRRDLELYNSYRELSYVPFVVLCVLQHWPQSGPNRIAIPPFVPGWDMKDGCSMSNREKPVPSAAAQHLDKFLDAARAVAVLRSRLDAIVVPKLVPSDILPVPVPPLYTVKAIPEVSDFSCDRRLLNAVALDAKGQPLPAGAGGAAAVPVPDGVSLTVKEMTDLASAPISAALGDSAFAQFVCFVNVAERISADPGFDVSKHPDAESHVAKELLKRLVNDKKTYSDEANSAREPRLVGLLNDELAALCRVDLTAVAERERALHAAAAATGSTAAGATSGSDVKGASAGAAAAAGTPTSPSTPAAATPAAKTPAPQPTKEQRDAFVKLALAWSKQSGAAIAKLQGLVAELDKLRAADAQQIPLCVSFVLAQANRVPFGGSAAGSNDAKAGDVKGAEVEARLKYLLSRYSGQETAVTLDFLTACLLSSKANRDLHTLNPFLTPGVDGVLLDVMAAICLRANRIGLLNRCVQQAQQIVALINGLPKPTMFDTPKQMDDRANHFKVLVNETTALAGNLATRRFTIGKQAGFDKDFVYDPRFVVFEYLFDLMLRKQQVLLVNTFLSASRKGDSAVQQMIMGAGKTTVIGPLMALILADGQSLVTQVVPTPLLEFSRGIMRSRFTRIISKRIHTFHFDRTVKRVKDITRLFDKLNAARKTRGIVVTTPEAIKSLFLKQIELLHQLETAPARLTIEKVQQLSIRSEMADQLANVIQLWQKGVLIMDEVDLLLHPLRSELNFPIGQKEPLDMSPHRWELAIHLLDAMFYVETGEMSVNFKESAVALDLLDQIKGVVGDGIAQRSFQTSPHLVLLDPAFYHSKLKGLLAQWVLLYLRAKQFVATAVADDVLIQFVLGGPNAPAPVLEAIKAAHTNEQKKLLTLAHDWLQSLTPHVLSKINRVAYGMLSKNDMALVDANTPESRKLVAVPFVGKDVPSHASEFAHPDVLIGLSILAYRYEGLRMSDLRRVVAQLQRDMRNEIGPMSSRPSSVLFQQWLEKGERFKRLNIEREAKMPTLQRSMSERAAAQSREAAEAKLRAQELEHGVKYGAIVPLPIFQLADKHQMQSLFERVSKLPELVHHYIEKIVFPAVCTYQQLKLSASGQELGGAVLFARRFGFSGTPSSLLPLELGECGYEKGVEGKVVTTLTDEKVVSYSVHENWSVRQLLKEIAESNPPAHALIDTGALITGMSNKQVARYLLDKGLASFDGVVFLDRHDRQKILLRSTGKVLPLNQCGVSVAKRFTFYDQVHTTGMDIKQHLNARAVLTLGKDMTFRDYSQGAYRMRGIGKGQTVHLYIIPEVLKLIRKEAPESGSMQRNVAAWLTINSMRSEKLQFMQLCVQNLKNVWRKRAYETLLTETSTRAISNSERRYWRFQEVSGPYIDRLKKCVGVFREKLEFQINADLTNSPSFEQSLQTSLAENKEFVPPTDARATADVATVMALAKGTGSQRDLIESRALNSEMVQEAEQEAEKQKDKRVQQEQQTQVRFSRDEEQQIPWPVEDLIRFVPPDPPAPQTGAAGSSGAARTVKPKHAFYPFAQFSLRPGVYGTGRSDLALPSYMLVSHNHFRPEWAAMGQRRLKNMACVLEWAPRPSLMPRTASQLAGPKLTDEQDASLRKAFSMFDADGVGKVKLTELKTVMRAVGEDLSDDELAAITRVLDKDKSGAIAFADFRQFMFERFQHSEDGQRYFVALSLTEAESLRRVIHTGHSVFDTQTNVQLCLRTMDGHLLDRTVQYQASAQAQQSLALQCFRFFNCNFFYDDAQIALLLRGLQRNREVVRQAFFENVLRCRRRDRQRWNDTPLAKVFTVPDEYHLLAHRAKIARIRAAVQKKGMLLLDAFNAFDSVGDNMLNKTELAYALRWLDIDMSPADIAELVRHADKDGDGLIDVHEFSALFRDPYAKDDDATGAGADDGRTVTYATDRKDRDGKPARKFERLNLPPQFVAQYRREEEELKERKLKAEQAAREVTRRKELEEKLARDAEEERRKIAAAEMAKHEAERARKLTAQGGSAAHWNCGVCSFLNKPERRKCAVCSTPRPADADAKGAGADATDDDPVDDGGDTWECDTCTYGFNAPAQGVCMMCGVGKKPKANTKKIKVVDVLLWECECTRMNTSDNRDCQTCGKSRPPNAKLFSSVTKKH